MKEFPRVLIFGSGQVAQVFLDTLYRSGHEIVANVVDREFKRAGDVPFDEVEKCFSPQYGGYQFTVGMSYRGLNKPRAEKFAAMLAKGYEPLTFVDPRADVETNMIGSGSFIMNANTVQYGAALGRNCILWSGNHIGHHTKIGNHVFIASHAVIGGACEIGDNCFIGVNATIRDGVKIGPRCVIGAGALILSDCEADGVYGAEPTPRSRVPSNRLRGI